MRTAEMQAVLDQLALRQRRNVLLAAGAVVAASGLYSAQRLNPADPVKLLRRMEAQSPPLESALRNGKPTVVEFYAPWCESCKLGARDMLKLERRYAGQINFVTLNGDDPRNARVVDIFGVDSIPHIALLTGERALRNTLVGAVPAPILEREILKLMPS
jgi:thiol-disulfide isomerase/thioredoxin